MTGREFIQQYVEMYGLTEKEVLELLDEYLLTRNSVEFVGFAEYPDFDLSNDFLYDPDEPLAFEKWFEKKLWSWKEDFDSNTAPF